MAQSTANHFKAVRCFYYVNAIHGTDTASSDDPSKVYVNYSSEPTGFYY